MGRKAGQIAPTIKGASSAALCRSLHRTAALIFTLNASTFAHEKARIKMVDGGGRELPISRWGNLRWIMILAISLLIGFGVSAFIMAVALVLFAVIFDERAVN